MQVTAAMGVKVAALRLLAAPGRHQVALAAVAVGRKMLEAELGPVLVVVSAFSGWVRRVLVALSVAQEELVVAAVLVVQAILKLNMAAHMAAVAVPVPGNRTGSAAAVTGVWAQSASSGVLAELSHQQTQGICNA
jgi:hypothetical protein